MTNAYNCEVERVIGRKVENETTFYLIKWRASHDSTQMKRAKIEWHASWVPALWLTNSIREIERFEFGNKFSSS